jgi:hypothetical protein
LDAPVIFEIVVTLDDLTPLSASAHVFQDFGTISAADLVPWIVSLSDLIVVTDLLRNTELVHYMTRREKINRLRRVYAHDELDWVGHYLAEGLYFDPIFVGPDAPHHYRLLSYTESIDNWYFAQEGGRTVDTERPSRRLPDTIRGLVGALERERPEHFAVAGLLMRDWSDDTTTEMARWVEDGRERAARQGWASATAAFAPYGFSWCVDLRAPGRAHRAARWLADRERPPEENRPLWVAVGEDRYLGLGVALRGEPDIRHAIVDALFAPQAAAASSDFEVASDASQDLDAGASEDLS